MCCASGPAVDVSETPNAVMYEPDARRARLMIRERATRAETHSEHRSVERPEADSKRGTSGGIRKQRDRKCTMRAMYLAQDNPALTETVATLSRLSRAPTDGDEQMLKKRPGRFS